MTNPSVAVTHRDGEVLPALFAGLFDDAAMFPPGNPPSTRLAAVETAVPDGLSAATPLLAKFRTGGVRADLYPDERELARALVTAVRAGVPCKATAGLHHALRNTDTQTGFEQHGFLNVLTATSAALDGADTAAVAAALAERDADRIVARVSALVPDRVRAAFRSLGTCSIDEPVAELTALGLLDTKQLGRAS